MKHFFAIAVGGLCIVGVAAIFNLTFQRANYVSKADGVSSNRSCTEEDYFKRKFIELVSGVRHENDISEGAIKRNLGRLYRGEIVRNSSGFEYKMYICRYQPIVMSVEKTIYDKESNGMTVTIRFRSPEITDACAFSTENVSNDPLLRDFDRRIIQGHPLSGELWVFQRRDVSAVFSVGPPGRINEFPGVTCINSVNVFVRRN